MRPANGRKLSHADQASSPSDLPEQIADVVAAVRAGVVTSRAYADLHGLSIACASYRFRRARELGWIAPVSENGRSVLYRLVEDREGVVQ